MARKKKKLKKRSVPKIDIDQILLRSKELFLYDVIDDKKAEKLVKELRTFDKLLATSKKKKVSPILLTIHSPGGSISDGVAILDAMRLSTSPIITFISGIACSMAGLISVMGNKRIMTKDSIWMAHPPKGGVSSDYFNFEKDRIKLLNLHEKLIDKILTKHTELSPKEINKAKSGELWLSADECLKKGVVDLVV